MRIEGFLNGAFLVNTEGAEVDHMVFANNEVYGAFYNSSTGGDYHHNIAYGSAEAGLRRGAGTGNRFADNRCETSSPAGLSAAMTRATTTTKRNAATMTAASDR
jgi:hypothetical protein